MQKSSKFVPNEYCKVCCGLDFCKNNGCILNAEDTQTKEIETKLPNFYIDKTNDNKI